MVKSYTLEQFAGETSLHGFKNVIGVSYADTKSRKAGWAILFTFFTIVVTIFLGATIYRYFQYGSMSTVTQEIQDALDFPAVTFCPIQQNAFNNPLFDQYMKMSQNLSSELYTNHTYYDWFMEQFKQLTIVEYLDTVTYSSEETLIWCKFHSHDIPCSSYIFEFVTDVGKCFSFNNNQYTYFNGSMNVTNVGSKFGLQLTLDAHAENVDTFTGYLGIGFLVLVHNPQIYPLMKERAFLLSPGVQTYVQIKRYENERLSVPYSNSECIEMGRQVANHYVYSQELCLYRCLNEKLYNGTCVMLEHETTKQACTMFHSLVYAFHLYEEQASIIQECRCLPTCYSINFDYSVTTTIVAESNLMQIAKWHNWTSQNSTYMKRNYAHLNIFYDSLDYTLTVQKPSLSYQSVLADIGGLLGICLGASFITLIEIIEFIVSKVAGRMCNQPKQVKPENKLPED